MNLKKAGVSQPKYRNFTPLYTLSDQSLQYCRLLVYISEKAARRAWSEFSIHVSTVSVFLNFIHLDVLQLSVTCIIQ